MSAQKKPAAKKTYSTVLKERADKLKIPPDSRLAQLVTDPAITKAIAAAQDPLYKVIMAYQQSVTSPNNVANIGPAILAMGSLQSLLDTIAGFGVQDTQVQTQPDNPDTDNDNE